MMMNSQLRDNARISGASEYCGWLAGQRKDCLPDVIVVSSQRQLEFLRSLDRTTNGAVLFCVANIARLKCLASLFAFRYVFAFPVVAACKPLFTLYGTCEARHRSARMSWAASLQPVPHRPPSFAFPRSPSRRSLEMRASFPAQNVVEVKQFILTVDCLWRLPCKHSFGWFELFGGKQSKC